MKKLLIVLVLACIIVVSGCITGQTTAKEREYVCSDGSIVSDPSYCPKITTTTIKAGPYCGDGICQVDELKCEANTVGIIKRVCSEDCDKCPGDLDVNRGFMHACRYEGDEWCSVSAYNLYAYTGKEHNSGVFLKYILNRGESTLNGVKVDFYCEEDDWEDWIETFVVKIGDPEEKVTTEYFSIEMGDSYLLNIGVYGLISSIGEREFNCKVVYIALGTGQTFEDDITIYTK